MRKAILLPVMLCAFFAVSHAQINLGKVKNKASKTVKDKKKEAEQKVTDPNKDSSSSSSSGSSSDGSLNEPKSDSDKEKAAIKRSPAKDILWDLRSELSMLEDRVGKVDFEEKRSNVEGMLKEVKRKDPTFSYWDQYKQRADKAEFAHQSNDIRMRLQSEFGWMSGQLEEFYKNLPRFERRKFDSLTEKYNLLVENNKSDSYLDKHYAKIVDFYGNESENVQKILDFHSEAHGKSPLWVKTERSKPTFYTNKSSKTMRSFFEECLKSVEYAINVFSQAKAVFPGNASLNAHYNKLSSIQKDLAQYKSSGGLDKDIKEVEKQELEEMRMSKPVISNSQVEGFVKSEFGKRASEINIKRVVLRTDWFTKKSVTGTPLYKGIEVEVAYSYNGKCYFTTGMVYKNYQGGGRYSGLTLDDELLTFTNYDKGVALKCENIFK